MKELYTMPIIKGIKDIKWNLSREGFKEMLDTTKSLFTEEKKLKKWVYLYTFIVAPILNFLILRIQEPQLILLHGPPPTFKFSLINLILVAVLITFNIFTFTITLLSFDKIKSILFASMFTQILILFFEINIIRTYSLSSADSEQLIILFFILCTLSILFALVHLLKMVYLRIKARIIIIKMKNSEN